MSVISWAQQDLNLRLQPCEGRTLPLSYAPEDFYADAYRITALTATRTIASGVALRDDRGDVLRLRVARHGLTTERQRAEEDSECEREHREVAEEGA